MAGRMVSSEALASSACYWGTCIMGNERHVWLLMALENKQNVLKFNKGDTPCVASKLVKSVLL
jgi:hypothetical protein